MVELTSKSVPSSSGLGLGTVRALLDAEANLSILDLSPPPTDDKFNTKNVRYFKTDITKLDEIQNAVEQTVAWTKESGKPLGGVINCAGVGAAAKVCYTSM